MALAIPKETTKFSLAQVGKGWEDCYVNYTSSDNYDDLANILDLDEKGESEAAQLKAMLDFVRAHITGGQLLDANPDGTTKLVPYDPSHVGQLPRKIIDRLSAEINGTPDPKGDEPTESSSSASEKTLTPGTSEK